MTRGLRDRKGLASGALVARLAAVVTVAAAAGYLAMGGGAQAPAPVAVAVAPVAGSRFVEEPAVTQGVAIEEAATAAAGASPGVAAAAVTPVPAEPEKTKSAFEEIAASAPVSAGHEGYYPVLFQELSDFDYRPFNLPEGSTTAAAELIPPRVRDLDERLVETAGFMMPIEADSNGVHSFLLMRDQSLCCFGVMPRPNDMILVTMTEGKTAEYFADVPVRVSGKMEVGPREGSDEAILIYRMEGHRLKGPSGI